MLSILEFLDGQRQGVSVRRGQRHASLRLSSYRGSGRRAKRSLLRRRHIGLTKLSLGAAATRLYGGRQPAQERKVCWVPTRIGGRQ